MKTKMPGDLHLGDRLVSYAQTGRPLSPTVGKPAGSVRVLGVNGTAGGLTFVNTEEGVLRMDSTLPVEVE